MSISTVNLTHFDDSHVSLFSVANEWVKQEDGVKKLFVKPYSLVLNWIRWTNPTLKKSLKLQKDALSHVKTIFSWSELPGDIADLSEKVHQLKKSISEHSLWHTLVYTSKISEYYFAMSDLCLGSLNPLAPSKKVYFSYNYSNTLSVFGLFENLSYLITSIHRLLLEFKHLLHISKENPKYTLAYIRIVKRLPTFFLCLGGIAFFFFGICFIPKLLFLILSTTHIVMQIACYFFKELHLSKPINSVDNFIALLPQNDV